MALLTELEIDEVSLVDAGANPESKIVLYKRKEDQVEEQNQAAPVEAEAAPAQNETQPEAAPVEDSAGVELRKRLDAIELENANLKRELAKQREDSERKEAIAKAAVFSNVPGAGSQELAELIYNAAVLPVASYETLMDVLSATQKALGTLVQPVGQDVQSFEGGSAEDRIESLVKSVQKRDGLPRPQAMAKVCAENPELYREYRSEKQKQVKGK